MSCTYAVIYKRQHWRIFHRVPLSLLSSRMVDPANYGAVDMYAATGTTVGSLVAWSSFRSCNKTRSLTLKTTNG